MEYNPKQIRINNQNSLLMYPTIPMDYDKFILHKSLLMISFDQILETKIGTGLYQGKTLFIIGLVEFCDGIEYTFMSILIAIL